MLKKLFSVLQARKNNTSPPPMSSVTSLETPADSHDGASSVSSLDGEQTWAEYNRVLVITGAGQPNGIGQAVAREAVLNHGYAVVIGTHSRSSPEQLDKFVSELNAVASSKSAYPETHTTTSTLQRRKHVAIWRHCDVTDWKSLQDFFAVAAEEFGGVDAVFCNAGVAAPYKKASFDQKEAPQYPALDVNVTGAIYTIDAALAYFEANPRPNQVIIPTISMAGFNPIPVNPIYSASKAALLGATMSFARRLELSKKPVRIAAIAPYYLRTNLCPQAFVDRIGEANLVPMEAVVDVTMELFSPESTKHGVVVKVQPLLESDRVKENGVNGTHATAKARVEDWVPAAVNFFGIPE
ncbi:hypothetical protein FQN54_002688 [Arachnomyces sp. PD_36]|nr:hypothetical protein FQN54_002688 [Arachnomyces sp. PD_36]